MSSGGGSKVGRHEGNSSTTHTEEHSNALHPLGKEKALSSGRQAIEKKELQPELTVTVQVQQSKKQPEPACNTDNKYTDTDISAHAQYPQNNFATPFGKRVDKEHGKSGAAKGHLEQSPNNAYFESGKQVNLRRKDDSEKRKSQGGYTTNFVDESMPEERSVCYKESEFEMKNVLQLNKHK